MLKLKLKPQDFGRRLVVELWTYPDGSRVVELSTKTNPAEDIQTAVAARAFLTSKGISLSGEQQTKTKTALEFFAAELAAG